jgi:PAS domain S-box-containing protein
MKFVIKSIVLLLIFVIHFYTVSSQNSIPVSKEGILNLKGWDFMIDGNVELNGEWEFYWLKLYTPEDFKSVLKPDAFLDVPGGWSGKKIDGKMLPDTGFATYRLLIYTDSNVDHDMMIAFKEIITAYNVWINGVKITEFGKVATNSNEDKPEIRVNKKSIELINGINEIIIQISNYDNKRNSFDRAPLIGEGNKINLSLLKSISFNLVVLGFLIIMSFYHLGLFFFRRKFISALIFSIFSIIIAIRILVTSNFILTYFYPDISLETIYRISYFTYYAGLAAIILYIQLTFNEKKYKWIFNSLYIISAIYIFTLILPSIYYIQLSVIYQLLSAIYILFALILLIKYSAEKKQGALIFLVSIIFISLSVINDTLYLNNLIKTIQITPIGIFILILGQSLTSIKIFTNSYDENEDLSAQLEFQNSNLQQTVSERTLKIKLQNETLATQNNKLESLNNQLKKYFVAIEQSPMSIVITDTNSIIEYVNPAFSKLTKYSGEEAIGNKTNILNSGKNPEGTFNDLWNTILKGKVWKGEFINRAKDGIEYVERAIISPVFNENEYIVSYLAIKEDITELRNNENLIKDKNKKLQILYIELQKAHKDILASINYSKGLQKALLPSAEVLLTLLKEYLLIYSPKETVSGDFYYASKLENKVIFAVGDCTGHGVPGAFMTTLSISILHNYVMRNINSPAEILENLRIDFKSIFEDFGKSVYEGMDIALCIFDLEKRKLSFSGANLSIFIVNNQEIIEYKGTRNPIGFHPYEKKYIENNIEISNNENIYLATDGILNIFNDGGLIKFSKSRFKELIFEINNLSVTQKQEKIDFFMKKWKEKNVQIDDITLLGIKFSDI